LGRGLEGGFGGWCEGDGKVGFCCFVKLRGGYGGCCLGIMLDMKIFHSWTSAGLGVLKRMCLVVVLVLAAFLTRSFRLSYRQSRSSTNASHVSKYSLTLTWKATRESRLTLSTLPFSLLQSLNPLTPSARFLPPLHHPPSMHPSYLWGRFLASPKGTCLPERICLHCIELIYSKLLFRTFI